MHWRFKALLQKTLATSRLGDAINHIPATLHKDYHKNVCIYQFYEGVRKYEEALQYVDKPIKTALEIGTGYSIMAPVVLSLIGIEKIVTVDITRDVSFKYFKKQIVHLDIPDIKNRLTEISEYSASVLDKKIKVLQNANTIEDVFKVCNITYIPKYTFDTIAKECSTFDYIYSQVVLEHVDLDSMNEMFHRFSVWLDNKGISVHTINFIDHFTNPGMFEDKKISEFNFLKYSDKFWSFWSGNAISFTNRVSYPYFIELCNKFELQVVSFKGENYRPSRSFDIDTIHKDVLRKYNERVEKADLIKYQRGTLVFRKE